MAYIIPDVYVQREPNSQKADTTMSRTVSGFIGVTERGTVGVAQEVRSWAEFVSKFAKGMTSPFYLNSILAYSVYGYFLNGGGKCYVTRVTSDTSDVASVQIGVAGTGPIISAKDEGTWGNKLSVTVTANAVNTSNFDIVVSSTASGTAVTVETFTNVSNTTTDERYFLEVLNNSSRYVTSTTGTLVAQAVTAMTGGLDGIDDIADDDFTDALTSFSALQDLNMIAIPGQTSTTVRTALITYADTKKVVVFPDLAPTTTATEALDLRTAGLEGNAMLYFPPVADVIDPLSPLGSTKEVPVSGHIMGVICRMVGEYGIGQSPSGVNAVIKGFVDLAYLDEDDLTDLYSGQINPIVNDPDYGIVIWGDTSISADPRFERGANLLLGNWLETYIYRSTKWVVFKSINELLMEQVKIQVDGILGDLWKEGSLRGATSAEAFFTKCDTENNTAETIADKQLICQVAYRPNVSANFVIFTISHLVD